MSRNKRKGLRAGYRKAGPTLRFTIKFSIVALILGVFYFLYDWQFAATKEGQKEARIQREEIHREEMEYLKEIPKLRGSLLQLKTVFRDRDNNRINVVPEIEIIESKIISAQRGYIKIRVATQFLNAVYDDFVSLSYEYERYQPVMLTFVNDTLWGAGVIFSSPEYRNTATVYLNQCFRFKGGGRMTYTEDLVFQPAMHGNLHYERYLLADSARTGTPLGFDKNGNSVVQGDSIAGLDYDPYFVLSNWSLNPPVAIVDDNQDSIIAAYELRNHDLRFNYSGSDFTAQIVMSSSYGLMHPLAVTLIDEVGYQSRSPQDMFDPEKAILWGTFNLSDTYYDPDVVNTSYSWNERWRTAIGKYNGGRGASESGGNFSNSSIAAYVEEVWLHIDQYQPVLSP